MTRWMHLKNLMCKRAEGKRGVFGGRGRAGGGGCPPFLLSVPSLLMGKCFSREYGLLEMYHTSDDGR